MKYLYKNKILHKDLKPDNILLDEYLHPKICDFVLSVKMMSTNKNDLIKQQKIAGTPLYMAPEIINEIANPYSYKSDVYSFAMSVYEFFFF